MHSIPRLGLAWRTAYPAVSLLPSESYRPWYGPPMPAAAPGLARRARYFRELVPLPLGEGALAAAAVAALTIVNGLGVRAGSAAQSVLMVLKICALAALIGAGLLYAGAVPSSSGAKASAGGLGAALVPVLFAYGGWQTACFVAGEMKEPRRD